MVSVLRPSPPSAATDDREGDPEDHQRRRPRRRAAARLGALAAGQVPRPRAQGGPPRHRADRLRRYRQLQRGLRRRLAHEGRLLALRRPRVHAQADGRRRRLSERGDDAHADHVRRHAPGLLRPGRAARRHGRELGRGVDVLPDVPPVLRPDVPRRSRQGARPGLRQGLQRLDGRGVVWRLGWPPHPALPDPAVGRRRRGRRGPAQRGTGRAAPSASASFRTTSDCPRSTPGTGIRSSPRAPTPAPSWRCTSARRRRCPRHRPTRRRR